TRYTYCPNITSPYTEPSHVSSSIPPTRHIPTRTLRFIQRLILPPTPPPSTQTEENNQSTPCNNNPFPRLVPRLLRAKEKIRSKPMRYRRETACNGYQRHSFCPRTRDDCSFPGYLDQRPRNKYTSVTTCLK